MECLHERQCSAALLVFKILLWLFFFVCFSSPLEYSAFLSLCANLNIQRWVIEIHGIRVLSNTYCALNGNGGASLTGAHSQNKRNKNQGEKLLSIFYSNAA